MGMTFFFKIGTAVFGTSVAVTVLSIILALGPLPALFSRMYDSLTWEVKFAIILGEVVIAGLLVHCGNVYFSNFRFPDTIISSLYSTAEETLLSASHYACKINYADCYAHESNSYVFEAVYMDTGEKIEAGEIIPSTTSITLYTTYDYSKISEYQSGSLTIEQMKEVTLDRIVATNISGSYFVGDKVEKYDLKVVAYYSDGSEKEIETDAFEILTDTVLGQAGDNIITVSYSEDGITETYNLTVIAEEAVLTSISAKYLGTDLMEGEEIDPADFIVVAYYSDDRECVIGEGQFTYEPEVVTAGSNTVTITYSGKKTTCKIQSYAENEVRPIDETEPNDTFDNPTSITAPSNITGNISDSADVDVYEITLSEAGTLNIGINSEMEYTAISVYKSTSSDAIWYSDDNRYDSSVGVWKKTFSLDLSSGTYKIKITGQQYGDSESTTGAYSVAISFDPTGCTENERHTSLDTAQQISIDCDVIDQISLTDRNQFYCFEVVESTKIIFKTTSYMNYISWWLYPATETDSFYSSVDVMKTESLEKTINTYTIYFQPGTYYLRISGRDGSTDASDTGKFLFSMTSNACDISDSEQFTTGSVLNGIVASNEASIQYDMTIPANGKIDLTVNTEENGSLGNVGVFSRK